jgi:hypothetical protein
VASSNVRHKVERWPLNQVFTAMKSLKARERAVGLVYMNFLSSAEPAERQEANRKGINMTGKALRGFIIILHGVYNAV